MRKADSSVNEVRVSGRVYQIDDGGDFKFMLSLADGTDIWAIANNDDVARYVSKWIDADPDPVKVTVEGSIGEYPCSSQISLFVDRVYLWPL
jgi:hypothetical protein